MSSLSRHSNKGANADQPSPFSMKTTVILRSGEDCYHLYHLCSKVKIQRKRNRKNYVKSWSALKKLNQILLTEVVTAVPDWTVKPIAVTEKWMKWNPYFYALKNGLRFMHNGQWQSLGKQFCLISVYIESHSFKIQWCCQLWMWSPFILPVMNSRLCLWENNLFVYRYQKKLEIIGRFESKLTKKILIV